MKIRPEFLIVGCVFVMTAAYLAYLALTWQAYQADRAGRDQKIDELLTRIPKAKASEDGTA